MFVYQYVDSFYIQLYLDLHELEINEMKNPIINPNPVSSH
jgi:hypothetical protein